jgi:hypothetical protein
MQTNLFTRTLFYASVGMERDERKNATERAQNETANTRERKKKEKKKTPWT